MRVTSQTNANTSTKKVFVGLSGGVDSAVSAALLQKEGYEVTGVFIRIALPGYPCTAGEDKLDAMRVAAHLRIPFRSIDLSEEYEKRVFAHAIQEFGSGRTPNPDALCNKEIKFGLFFEWCVAEGADVVATGHYAQSREGQLYAGVDEEKDQSYFLWAVDTARLAKTIFPLGELKKSEVRALAQKFGLPNAERKDSQGLCFLGPISVGDMLARELAPRAGVVLNTAGEAVGEHEGALRYTLGQRHGFTLQARSPHTAPHFVVAKDIKNNTITVSTEKYPQGVSRTHVQLQDINWIGQVPDGEYLARFRYRQALIPARKEGSHVTLQQPHYVPEGQSLVLYKDDRCMGGGIVDSSRLE